MQPLFESLEAKTTIELSFGDADNEDQKNNNNPLTTISEKAINPRLSQSTYIERKSTIKEFKNVKARVDSNLDNPRAYQSPFKSSKFMRSETTNNSSMNSIPKKKYRMRF